MKLIAKTAAIILTLILVTLSAFFGVYAGENEFDISEEELNRLISGAFDIYSLAYEGEHNLDYLDGEDAWQYVTDEYTELAYSQENSGNYVRLREEFRTEDQMREHYKKYFSPDIADKAVGISTLWLKNVNGQIVFMYDAKQYPDYKRADDPEIKLISVQGNSAAYSYEIVHNIDQSSSETVTKTFVIRSESDGYKIVGGTFVSDMLLVNIVPSTGDPTAIHALFALLTLLICIAAIGHRRKKFF